MALNPRGTFGETQPAPGVPLIPYRSGLPIDYILALGGQLPVGYYNSGFTAGGLLRGLGTALSYGGAIAATIPTITRAVYGGAPATQHAAAGPTAMPAAPTTAVGRAVQAAEHPVLTTEHLLGITGGMGGAAGPHKGRYGTPGEKGYHMIKKGPHAGMWVRNRHRNVANIHALRRSLSRIHGFEKICRKVVHFVQPRRAVGHAVFKKRKRS